jgi:4-deoxy-L-threo-5-hexosulose-uronate ketol-isomerase
LEYKEAFYIDRGSKNAIFESFSENVPAKFYINSATAHKAYPCKKVSKSYAEVVVHSALETSNHPTINKLIVQNILPTCQLQMGMTELQADFYF